MGKIHQKFWFVYIYISIYISIERERLLYIYIIKHISNASQTVLNDVYSLVENLEAALLCSLECGEDPSEILVCIYSLYKKKEIYIYIIKYISNASKTVINEVYIYRERERERERERLLFSI